MSIEMYSKALYYTLVQEENQLDGLATKSSLVGWVVVPFLVAESTTSESRRFWEMTQMESDSGSDLDFESDSDLVPDHWTQPVAWARTFLCYLHTFVAAIASAASEHTRTILVLAVLA